jgi:hypothetical protein
VDVKTNKKRNVFLELERAIERRQGWESFDRIEGGHT